MEWKQSSKIAFQHEEIDCLALRLPGDGEVATDPIHEYPTLALRYSTLLCRIGAI